MAEYAKFDAARRLRRQEDGAVSIVALKTVDEGPFPLHRPTQPPRTERRGRTYGPR